jgi:hypothetical protein
LRNEPTQEPITNAAMGKTTLINVSGVMKKKPGEESELEIAAGP